MSASTIRHRICLAALLVSSMAIASCSDRKNAPPRADPVGPAPESFRVAFETSRGRFVVEVHRPWAPNGVDRFYRLVAMGLLDENAFFRVVPGFIVQFGAFGDPKINAHWDSLRITDDPRVERNRRGTIAFAQEGVDSRAHQLFVNLSDNAHLDRSGFVPLGQVVDGMGVVDSIFAGYGEKPDYHLIATLGNTYLQRMYPKLDYIRTARIVP